MGITTPISTNDAMTIGGLTTGVTVLDMAHAYETIAEGGRRVGGSLVKGFQPVGINEVRFPNGKVDPTARVSSACSLRRWPAPRPRCSRRSIQSGTGQAANIGGFAAGKTGTTSNYGDAWFVGWNQQYTVAVWVGYPDKLVPMTTDFNGGPVLGGTFPALIWHNFMLSAMQIDQARAAAQGGATVPRAPRASTRTPLRPSRRQPARRPRARPLRPLRPPLRPPPVAPTRPRRRFRHPLLHRYAPPPPRRRRPSAAHLPPPAAVARQAGRPPGGRRRVPRAAR